MNERDDPLIECPDHPGAMLIAYSASLMLVTPENGPAAARYDCSVCGRMLRLVTVADVKRNNPELP